jgi:2',3'-cyclic-nucleotide 2'-phosphodiesterase (5'-nucleotidase family)
LITHRLAQEVKEIDLVLNGHDHFYEVRKADETGTWIINSGTDFRNATIVRIFLSGTPIHPTHQST